MNGVDIHLFVEYILRYGNLRTQTATFVTTMLGIPYTVNPQNAKGGLLFMGTDAAGGGQKRINGMVSALVSGCNMENARVSVTVFNSNNIVTIQSVTNNKQQLIHCATEKTFCIGENGGEIIGGYPICYETDMEKLHNQILELRRKDTGRKHIVVFVSECFPNHGKYYVEEAMKFFKQWRKEGVEYITFKLSNTSMDYPSLHNQRCEPMDDNLCKELSTIPEWTREGNYDEICFWLSELGQKLSNMYTLGMSQKLRELVKNDVNYQLSKEAKSYAKMMEKQEERQEKSVQNRLQISNKKSSVGEHRTILSSIFGIRKK